MNWHDLNLFLAVAREGGLNRASQIAQSSPATLGRRMLALEEAMGQELFMRHDRGYALTEKGQALFEKLRNIEADIHAATGSERSEMKPLVKISAGTWTSLYLMDHFGDLVNDPLDAHLRFVTSDIALDVRHREVIIGIRNQRPNEASLAIRKLSKVEFACYQKPNAPELWIKTLVDTPSARWVSSIAGHKIACEVNHPRNALDLALNGQGMVLLPTFIGDRHKALARVGLPIPELAHDRYLVAHADDRHAPHVRHVINRLVKIL